VLLLWWRPVSDSMRDRGPESWVGEQEMTGARRDWVMAACTAKPGAAEDYPFGGEVAVFKVAGRMFALVPRGARQRQPQV